MFSVVPISTIERTSHPIMKNHVILLAASQIKIGRALGEDGIKIEMLQGGTTIFDASNIICSKRL